jgi:transcriptional regulator with XRE-family HTH domain
MHDSEGQLDSFETLASPPQRGGAEHPRRLLCRTTVANLFGMGTRKRSGGVDMLKSDGRLRKGDGELKAAIGRRVRGLREAAGWSQAELERRADVGSGLVNRLESGTGSMISIEVVVRLSEVLQAPLDYLVYGKILKHSTQLSLLSGDADVSSSWAMAPGGTRAGRRILAERPARGAARPPKSAIVQPGKPTRGKPKG